MNMISTGAFLTEMDASNKQDTLVSKLVSVWEKKNSKTARAGGVSLMALSLAACGSSDDTSDAVSYTQAQLDAAKLAATSTAEAAATIAQAAAVAAVDTSSDDGAAVSLALRNAAADLSVTGTSTMTDAELITAIKTANDAAIAAGVDLTTDNTSSTNSAVVALGHSGVATLAQLNTAYTDAIAPAAASLNGTTSVDTLSGTTGADTFKFDNTGTDTSSTADTVDGGTGTDTIELFSDGAAGAMPILTSVETIHFYDQDASVDLSGAQQASLTKAMFTRGDGVLTATLPATIDTVSLSDITGTGVFTIALAAADAAITLDTNSLTFATAEDVTFTGAGLRTVVMNNTGTTTIGTLDAVGSTAVTVNATGKTTFINSIDTTSTAATLTVTGAGAVDVSAIDAGFTTVNASGNSGGFTGEIGTGDQMVLTGSSGNDSITGSSTDAIAAADLLAVDAGAGTDTLTLGDASDVNTAADAARYSNFETLSVVATQDMALISGITAVTLGANTSANLSKLSVTQAANITMTADNTTSSIFSFETNTASDAITINLKSGTATTDVDVVGISVDNIETVTFNPTTGTNTTGDTAIGFLANSADEVTALNFTGTSDVTFTVAANTLDVAAVTIDASAMTGTSDFTLVTGTLLSGSSVTTTDRADIIALSATLGTTYDSKAGNDSFTGSVADLVASGSNDNSINGGAGTDKITLDDVTTTLTDNHFTKISNMETLNLSNTTGDGSVTLGSAYNSAFASGMTMATGVIAATKDFTMAGGLATTAVKLTVDATAKVMTDTEDDTITTGSGDDTVTFTGDGTTVGVAGAAGGQLTINTGAGADTISLTVGTVVQTNETFITVTGGTGKDTITMTKVNANDAQGIAQFEIAAGDSTTSAYDKITGFDIGAASLFSDGLNFAGTAAVGTLGTQNDFGVIKSSSTTNGKADFDDAAGFATALVINSTNLADVLGYLNSNTATNDVISFDFDDDGNGTDDATMVWHNGTTDSLVLLAGITASDSVITTNAAAAGDIFIL
jgi:hypothetical protein